MVLPALANPERVALEVFAEVVEPPPPIDLNAWASAPGNVVMGSDSPSPGGYNPEFYPWFKAILAALGPDDPCTEVSLMKGIQLGGTVQAQIFIGGMLAQEPGPAMIVHPTEMNARRFVRQKWRPFIRNSVVLRRLFPARSRDAGASLDYQERIDGRGFVQQASAASPSELSQVSIKYMVQDDLDKWVSDGVTGDPERAADGRCEAYIRAGSAKILKIGNPVLKHDSRILRAWLRGTQERWHVACPHCGTEQPLEWENLRAALEFDRERFRADGMPDQEARDLAEQEAHFTCLGADCGRPIGQADVRRIIKGGRWVAANPRAGRRARSFHFWSAFVKPLSDIAAKWFTDKGHPESEQRFLNEEAGLAYEAAGESPEWEGLRDRGQGGHDRGTIPEGGLILVAAVDCQGDRVEAHVQAFGAGLRRWTVDYRIIPGHIREERAREALDRLLEEEFPNAFGHRRRIERLGIDAGAYKGEVEGWVERHSPKRVMMVRGHKDQHAPDLVVSVSRTKRREAKAVTGRSGHTIQWVGAAVIKGQLYGCLGLTDPLGPGWCGFPSGLEDEFYRQLCAERRMQQKGTGEWRWVPQYENNEVLDTAVYCQAMAVSLAWKANGSQRWEELRQRWETPAPAGPQADLFQPAPPQDPPTAPAPANAVRTIPAPPAAARPRSMADAWAAINTDD